MRPKQPDIDWCIEHRDALDRWLRERGGWQSGDHAWNTEIQAVHLLRDEHDAREGDIWLPCTDDMFEMLDESPNVEEVSSFMSQRGPRRCDAIAWFIDGTVEARGPTRLVALMKLLEAIGE